MRATFGTIFAAMAAAFACFTPCHVRGATMEFFLSPGAVDGDGSKTRPFGTFAEAQCAVRKAVADPSSPTGVVTVIVQDGVYRIDKPVSFCMADSGSAEHPVEWRAATRGGVRFSGGVPVPKLMPLAEDDPNWSRILEDVRAHVLVADLKAAGITDYGEVKTRGFGGPYMQLSWTGRYLRLARWPNDGYAKIADAPEGTDADGKRVYSSEFTYEGDRPSRWTCEPDACMNGFFYYWWVASHVAIGSVDPATHTIRQKMKPGIDVDRHKRPTIGSFSGYRKGMSWYGYNLLCELDAPGEYYIDRTLGRLYVWPPEDGTVHADAELTVADSIMILDGVSNLAFSGFVFENCRDSLFKARGCTNVDVVACVIRNSGGRGVTIEQGRNCRLSGCDIEWCNAGGALVSGGDPATLTHANVVVENCHIHHYALTELTYSAAVEMRGCGLAARQNTIHDGPHVAILLSNPSRENEVSWNEIHSVCMESGEMGVVYAGADWTLCGNRIEANYIHDIPSRRSDPNRAVMLDDGCAGISIVSNRFERVKEGVSLSGIGNVVENNLFIRNLTPVTGWQNWCCPADFEDRRHTHQRLLDSLASISVHQEPWLSKYPYLALVDDAMKTGAVRHPDTRTSLCRNVYVGCGTNFVSYYVYSPKCGGYSSVTWREENNSSDEHCPPRGFSPLPPLSKMGVQKTSDRATWPVSHAVMPITAEYGIAH